MSYKSWKLKKGHDARIRGRHPWVFSNELLDSPKGILPGEPIELQSIDGHFLARGYGNPHSLISFRALSFNKKEDFNIDCKHIVNRILNAWTYRFKNGFTLSHRICFSETDLLAGLIVDRYIFTKSGKTIQVFSYQLLTAGMDVFFKTDKNEIQLFELLCERAIEAGISDISWDQTVLLRRCDVNIRKLEGLQVEEPIIVKGAELDNLTEIEIQMQPAFKFAEALDKHVSFNVNLVAGQKTGFFLDQTYNIGLVLQNLYLRRKSFFGKKIKILDLCCYMGQWSAHVAAQLENWKIEAEVHLVDVSDLALHNAKLNVEKYCKRVAVYKKDVLKLDELDELWQHKFDVVISDPPAFVKNKKDLQPGLAAYTKLNTFAFKLAADGGLIASCTCSGAVTADEFKEALQKSVLKSGKFARAIGYGMQGLDHPHQLIFSEGFYLKMVLHQVETL